MGQWFKRLALLLSFGSPGGEALGAAAPPQVGDAAPEFELSLQDGSRFALNSRREVGWTVLYFYPKADTPGCTKQACAYRDGIQRIRSQKAEVYGISTDEVAQLAAFHQKYHLSFNLLSDPQGLVTEAYGVKMPVLSMAKRWTFLIDSKGVIRDINTEVDPALDASWVVDRLVALQAH